MEKLILVDRGDNPRGVEEKLRAHLNPERHRAFSVLIFNGRGETLIQRRAAGKYHSPSLWANTCCGHPLFLEDGTHEETKVAARRRLQEEMGFQVDLNPVAEVCYTLRLEKGLWELEYTHVFHGVYEGPICPEPKEVSEWKWIRPEDLRADMCQNPQNYARWFRLYALKHFDRIFTLRNDPRGEELRAQA